MMRLRRDRLGSVVRFRAGVSDPATRRACETTPRRSVIWTHEDCVNAALLYLEHEPGRKLTQRLYSTWVLKQPEHLPQASAFQRKGGMTEIVAEARRRRACGLASSGTANARS